jgi:hypothetical protein
MLAWMALAAGVLGGVWWLARGVRRTRRLYRGWRWRNSIVVYGYLEPGRAWFFDAALAAGLALAGPLVPREVDATRAWRAVSKLAAIVWLVAGAPPFDGAWW